MRWRVLLLVSSFLVLAAAEIGLHWYMVTSETPLASQLLDWYLYQNSDNHKKYHQGLVIFVIPCLLMGFAAGSLGAKWSTRKLIWTVVALSAGIMVLNLFCTSFLRADAFSHSQPRIPSAIPVIAICSAVAYGAKVLTVFLQEGRDITID